MNTLYLIKIDYACVHQTQLSLCSEILPAGIPILGLETKGPRRLVWSNLSPLARWYPFNTE